MCGQHWGNDTVLFKLFWIHVLLSQSQKHEELPCEINMTHHIANTGPEQY